MEQGKICVAIQVKDGPGALEEAALAKAQGADVVEFRFDYCDHFPDLDLTPFAAFEHPKIFTYRPASEGGFDPVLDEEARRQRLLDLTTLGPEYVDVEIRTGETYLQRVATAARASGSQVIFSWHNFEDTPPHSQIWAIVKRVSAYDLALHGVNRYVKVVTTAKTFGDNIKVMNMCKMAEVEGLNIIGFCMGSLGIFSRVMCVRYGSKMTYASIAGRTAPGQINIEEMQAALEFMGMFSYHASKLL